MSDELHVRLAPTAPGADAVKIYVNADAASELKSDLRAAGFETSDMMELAFGVDDAIIAVAAVFGTVGGLNGLASVLNAFFHKNQHKSLTVKSGDAEITVTGMSASKLQATFTGALEAVAKEQKLLDESWERILKETDETLPDAETDAQS